MGCAASDAHHSQVLSPIRIQSPVWTGLSQTLNQENFPKIRDLAPHVGSSDSLAKTADSEPRAMIKTIVPEIVVISCRFTHEKSFSYGGWLGQSHYLSENSLNELDEEDFSDDQKEVSIY
jgi:hypothetical protein